MSLVGTSGGDFTPHPTGVYAGTVVDVIDKGMRKNQWGVKHKFVLRVFCGEFTEDGVPMTVDQWLTLSTHKMSKARKLIEKGLGRKFNAKEEQSFDYEKLIGKSFQVVVSQNETGNGTYANIETMMPLPDGSEAPGVPEDYVREVDKDPAESRDARQQADESFGYGSNVEDQSVDESYESFDSDEDGDLSF